MRGGSVHFGNGLKTGGNKLQNSCVPARIPIRIIIAIGRGISQLGIKTYSLAGGNMFSPAWPIIKPGRNAWRSAKAEKLAFLIDAEDYFRRLDRMLRRAERSIFIIGWDFNPDIRLLPRDPDSPTLGQLLRQLVEKKPKLQIHILVWGMGPVYSSKTLKMFGKMEWSNHPRLRLELDFDHPLRASHHQKLVAIDDRLAFVGGIDLTARRWDDRSHAAVNPLRREPGGGAYGPVHDTQAIVSGAPARLVGDIARRRWKRAVHEAIEPTDPAQLSAETPWPDDLKPALTDCNTALALTEPWKWKGRRGHREAIRLTHDALKAAEHHLYIETQYLASFGVARTLARRLRKATGPEVVIVVTQETHGLLEEMMMGSNRNRLIRRLKRADRYNRLRVFYAAVPRDDGKGEEQEIVVHSKLIIADDRFVRVGSSNLNNRSEGLDTECDLAAESADPAGRAAIAAFRNDLIAEHLDAEPWQVAIVISETGSMLAAIDRLNIKPRGLRNFQLDVAKGETSSLFGTGFLDPKQPFWPIPEIRNGLRRLFGRFLQHRSL